MQNHDRNGEDTQVNHDHPRQNDRKFPIVTLGCRFDMVWWHVIMHIDIDSRVLEMRRIVDHVQH